jgi:hypothetical protein
LASTQCPYITGLLTAHSAVQLEGGQPPEHLGDRKLQLSGNVGSAKGQDVGQVRDDPVTLRP